MFILRLGNFLSYLLAEKETEDMLGSTATVAEMKI